jgi:hypothetical protein
LCNGAKKVVEIAKAEEIKFVTDWYEAFLMIEFDCKTKLPLTIMAYGEHENKITMIGNEYVRIASLKLKVQNPESEFAGMEFVCTILEQHLKNGMFNQCKVKYNDNIWTVEECVRIIFLSNK